MRVPAGEKRMAMESDKDLGGIRIKRAIERVPGG